MEQKMYLNKYSVGRPHCEYLLPLDFTVLLTNEERSIRKELVAADGSIRDFPGVEYSEALTRELGNREISPVVKYEARFERTEDGGFLMVWTVRPDGFYWADSWGFGAEDYESVELYAPIDRKGCFTGPFRLYRIGYGEKAVGGTGGNG